MHSTTRHSIGRGCPSTSEHRMSATLLALQLALFLGGCGNHAASEASNSASISSPAPNPTRCWIYDKIYPATDAAFDSQHLTAAERKEVEKWSEPASPAQVRLVKVASPWATPPTASEVHSIRWMRSGWDRSLFVFVAHPISVTSNGYSPWVALNTNVIINPVECEVGAYPTA
jgi:hypothetical protein